MKIYVFSIVLFIFSNAIFCQNTLIIECVDQKSTPIFYANIQVLDNEDVLHYGITDKNGIKKFENIIKEVVTIKISYLGFKTVEKKINLKENNVYKIVMEESVFELKEVIIKEYPKSFKTIEDTISYNLKSVVDGTERNLGEALNKLPGLEVDEKGVVSHQGQKIDKILIEGKDFFGNKHQMSTQTLKPEMIQGVDLLKNYSNNPLETKGGKTVLNLKLHDEYKNKFIGNTNLDIGILNKYNQHSNLFKFSSVGNLGIILDFNNIGETPITIEDYIEMRGGIFNFIENTGGNNVSTLDFNQFPKYIFSNDNFKDRNNNFVGLNYTFKNKKHELSSYNFLNYSKINERINKSRTRSALLNEINF